MLDVLFKNQTDNLRESEMTGANDEERRNKIKGDLRRREGD